MSFVFDVLPSLVSTADGLYDLIRKIYEDFQDWQIQKDQKKLKQILTDIKNLINKIDKIYSKLLLVDGLPKMDGTQYNHNKEKFEKLYLKIQDAREAIYMMTELDYFADYPELRDVLYIKLKEEMMYDENHPPPDPEPTPAENQEDFQQYVVDSSETTRKALIAMSNHIRDNFD